MLANLIMLSFIITLSFVSAGIARKKNRSSVGWFLLTFTLPFFIIVLLLLDPKKTVIEKEPNYYNPHTT